ncbi:hypothetical protein [Streptomyces sp. NPDC000395]|uniref:hypothetical protein n=1 Tax=Streptomyces sp. NPDC000395 TaxID=3154252 RepID=UPI00336A7D21
MFVTHRRPGPGKVISQRDVCQYSWRSPSDVISETYAASPAELAALQLASPSAGRSHTNEQTKAARIDPGGLRGKNGLEGVIRGLRRRTTVPEPASARPPDLVNRPKAA